MVSHLRLGLGWALSIDCWVGRWWRGEMFPLEISDGPINGAILNGSVDIITHTEVQ